MKLHINGEEGTFAAPPVQGPFTLAALIESLNMKPDRVAVELNREIIPRDRWPETPLKDGDRLEIVHFVGGGADTKETLISRRLADPDVSERICPRYSFCRG